VSFPKPSSVCRDSKIRTYPETLRGESSDRREWLRGNYWHSSVIRFSLFRYARIIADTAGAQSLIKAHIWDVAVVPFPEGAIDIDTRADYERLSVIHATSENWHPKA